MKAAKRFMAGALVAGALAGCATTSPAAPRSEVGELVASRGAPGDAIPIEQDAESRDKVEARIEALLDDPLTLDAALRIALLNNRELRHTLETLGVAQADLVEAGLLRNPTIGGDLVVSSAGNGLGGGLSLSQSLLSAFLIPAKRRVAKSQLQAAVIMVADATLQLVRDVKVAYVDLQAELAIRDLHRTLVQAAEVGDELAARQHEAGNISDLDRELMAANLDEARLELADHELTVSVAREQVNRLLGLWGEQTVWTLADGLPDRLDERLALAILESLGVQQRLDVAGARATVEIREHALELRRRGVVPELAAGVEARNEVGNDEGHEWVVGPSLSIEVPLFDPGHADFARLRAYLREAQHHLEHVAVLARSEIRTHREQLVTADQKVSYLRDTVLPRQEVLGDRAMERYNGMLIGAYELLEIRSRKAEAHEAYVEALRAYWVARADLERSVGGALPTG